MSEPDIGPSTPLTTPADPNSGQKSSFIMFSESWLQLQSFMGSALALPMAEDGFEAKYGAFSGEKVITACVGAMKDVRRTAAEFGDPKALRASLISNPNVLASSDPPDEIYTHCVWLGQKVHTTAQALQSGYGSVLDALPGLPRSEQVASLKEYLFDQTLGPIPLARTMSDECGKLIIKLGKFEQKMNEYNEKLQSFTGQSSTMVELVNTTIGTAEQKIKDLEESRDAAYKAWEDFTIAAVTCSVGCALIGTVLAPFTGGVSLLVGGAAAIATGVGLGAKAAENRAKYNTYCDMIATETAEKQKKIRLRSDLGDFDKAMGSVGPAMGSFLKQLQTIQGVWVQMNSDLLNINQNITEDNVGNVAFLVKAKATLAIGQWQDVDESAKQFTVQSLVDYDSLAFGQKLPESKAA